MKVLFLCSSRNCAHDYGGDFLIQGAYSHLGADNVFEFPEMRHLHLGSTEHRDECQIDSDAWLPLKQLTPDGWLQFIRHKCNEGAFDAVVLTSAHGTEFSVGQLINCIPASTPIVGLHYADTQESTRPLMEAMLGRKLAAYHHREKPPADAEPIWFSQPRSRVRAVEHKPRWGKHVFYHGTDHGWPSGNPRQRLAASLAEHLAPAELDILITANQHSRLTPEMYRERLWESPLSVVWNSNVDERFPVWDSNRFWESLALGCCLVAERPMYATPPGLDGGVVWIDSPEEAGERCRWLLDHPLDAFAIARAGQSAFVRLHTSESRMRRILSGVVKVPSATWDEA